VIGHQHEQEAGSLLSSWVGAIISVKMKRIVRLLWLSNLNRWHISW